MTKIRTTIGFEITGDVEGVLRKATEDAFAQVAGELTARFDDAVSGNYWPWPDATPRFGGSRDLESAADNWNTYLTGNGTGSRPKAVAGSPRSIVDSGNLKQSRDFNLNRVALTAEWNWNADYAAAVHEGAYINPFGNTNKVVQLPARPWTQAVIEGGTVATGIQVYPVAANLKKYITQRTG
jgi:hypothetical protein